MTPTQTMRSIMDKTVKIISKICCLFDSPQYG